MKPYVTFCIFFICFNYCFSTCQADCPSADMTGDCIVDFRDFAVIASQWQADGFADIELLSSQLLER
jgi:hypothetical protein